MSDAARAAISRQVYHHNTPRIVQEKEIVVNGLLQLESTQHISKGETGCVLTVAEEGARGSLRPQAGPKAHGLPGIAGLK